MSVTSLATTTVDIYGVTNTQSKYGSAKKSYVLKASKVPARIRYMSGEEKAFSDGKEETVPDVRIYFPGRPNIVETDFVVDNYRGVGGVRGHTYDVLLVNPLYTRRLTQVDCKRVTQVIPFSDLTDESSSSSSETP